MATVSLRKAIKIFGSVEVLHGVDLEIADGEFVVLVGPSGCGKSTLLRMIAGLESISDGELLIDGKRMNDVAPKDRDIAMVFQNYALYPHKTVAQNMGFSMELLRRPADQISAAVARAAEILGLSHLLDRFPRQLSGGQRQRVAMGRAIVRDPQVFLFDEPLSNLDAQLRVKMRTEIKALQHRLGTTTIFVTHDQVEAMTMADKIVVMRDGYIEQQGTPLELYDRPRNLFVASFIGSPQINLLPGILGADGTTVNLQGGQILVLPRRYPAQAGQKVTLGARPDHISLDETGRSSLIAKVSVIEPTGADNYVTATLNGEEIVLAMKERVALRPGDQAGIALDLERAIVFDQNGIALYD